MLIHMYIYDYVIFSSISIWLGRIIGFMPKNIIKIYEEVWHRLSLLESIPTLVVIVKASWLLPFLYIPLILTDLASFREDKKEWIWSK